MKLFDKILVLTVILLASSCARDVPQYPENENLRRDRQMAVEIHTLPFEGGYIEGKSALEDCLNKISSINVLVFNAESGKLMEKYSGCFTLAGLRKLTLPSPGVFNIYFFANVPDLTESFPIWESGMENFGYCMDSYDEMEDTGLPMSYFQQVDTGNEELINIWFRRLVTRFELSFDKSALSTLHKKGSFVKSMRIFNAALDIYPFGANGSAATRTTGTDVYGDRALDADVNILNAGGTVFLYTLTNMQGKLLPSGTPQSDKTPETLEPIVGADKLKLLTYIEAHCCLDCDDWSGEDVVLRHYPGGESTSDYNCSFNIHPGKSRSLCLALTEDDPLLQPWRFDAEGVVNHKKFTLSTSVVNTMKNFPTELSVSAPFDFEMTDGGKHFRAEILESVFDSSTEIWKKTIRIESCEALSGLLEPGEKASSFDEELVFRALTRSGRDTSVMVRTYHEVFPLILRVDKDGMLKLFGDNPLELSFRCDYEITDRNGNIIQNLISKECTPSLPGQSSAGYGNVIGKFSCNGQQSVILNMLIYPQWKGNSGFYMGTGNAALFGPGQKFSPGKHDCTDMIMYCPAGHYLPYTIGMSSNNEYTASLAYTHRNSDKAPQIFFLPTTVENDPSLWTTDGFSFGEPDYRFKLGAFSPPPSTGHNNCDNYLLSDFDTCPFYIANGCMQGLNLRLFTHGWSVDSNVQEITVNFLSPGRDLMAEGVAPGNEAESRLVFRIRGAVFLKKVYAAIDEASYSYSGVHLIVNGCTCWPGGSPERDGILSLAP